MSLDSSGDGSESAGWEIDERKSPMVARVPVAATCWVCADAEGRPRFLVTTDRKTEVRPIANPEGCAHSKREAWIVWSEKQRLAKGR